MTTSGLAADPVAATACVAPAGTDGRRALRLLWAGQSASLLGDQVTVLALPLAALATGASTLQVAIMISALHAPFLLLGLPAGVWVGRVGLRRSMLLSDLVRGSALLSVLLAALIGTVSYLHLLVVAMVIGCGSVLFLVAYQSLTPLLVTDHAHLRSANSRLTGTEALAMVGGPALAGLLVALVGPIRALAVDALTYAASVGTLAAMRVPDDRTPTPAQRLPLGREIRVGMRYVLASPPLRALLWSSVIFNAGVAGYEALLVVFAINHLGLSPADLGLAIGVGGVGVPIGLLLSAPLERRVGTGAVLVISAAFSGAGLLVTATASGRHSAVVIAAGTLVTAMGGGAWGLTALTTRQTLSRPDMRAMTTAVHRWATYGVLPLGAVTAGLAASLLGPRVAMLLAGLTAQLCVVPLLRSSLRSSRTLVPAHADAGSSPACPTPEYERGRSLRGAQ